MYEAVQFGHDRIREAVLRSLNDEQRHGLQLTIARRLAAIPEMFAVAAEQYLPVIDAVDEPTERHAVGLLRHAADQASVIGDYALMGTLLAAGAEPRRPVETDTLLELRTARHAALYGMGRLDEADEEYRAIEAVCRDPVDLAKAAAVQVRSPTHARRLPEAIALGLDVLAQLGIAVPTTDGMLAELDQRFENLLRWLGHGPDDDLARPELTDPTMLAGSRVIDAIQPAAYGRSLTDGLAEPAGAAIWREHGPARPLVGAATGIPVAAVALRNNYALPYRALRRLLALSEARGYEPETSQPRFLLALLGWWFEPLEDSVDEARQAKEGWIGGRPRPAAYTYATTVRALLECAPSLDVCVAELDAGLAFVRRIGSVNMVEVLETYQWVIDCAANGPPQRRAYIHRRVQRHPSNPSSCIQPSKPWPPPSSAIGLSSATPQKPCLGAGLAH